MWSGRWRWCRRLSRLDLAGEPAFLLKTGSTRRRHYARHDMNNYVHTRTTSLTMEPRTILSNKQHDGPRASSPPALIQRDIASRQEEDANQPTYYYLDYSQQLTGSQVPTSLRTDSSPQTCNDSCISGFLPSASRPRSRSSDDLFAFHPRHLAAQTGKHLKCELGEQGRGSSLHHESPYPSRFQHPPVK